ncbi:MAG: hypothetical protein JWO59_3420, partial [Chloroflexi bacterium]|nr:hypothetical protein [Chloroflexota bacterium]
MSFTEHWLDWLRALSPRLIVTQIPAASADELPEEAWEKVEVLYA